MSADGLDLKKIIKLKKDEILPFGLALPKAKGEPPIFIVHRTHSIKKLLKTAKTESGSTKGIAGRLRVNGNTIELTCLEGKPTTLLARRLRMHLKKNGCKLKVELMGDTGLPFLDCLEEVDETDTASAKSANPADERRRAKLDQTLGRLESALKAMKTSGKVDQAALLKLVIRHREALHDKGAYLDKIERFSRDVAAALKKIGKPDASPGPSGGKEATKSDKAIAVQALKVQKLQSARQAVHDKIRAEGGGKTLREQISSTKYNIINMKIAQDRIDKILKSLDGYKDWATKNKDYDLPEPSDKVKKVAGDLVRKGLEQHPAGKVANKVAQGVEKGNELLIEKQIRDMYADMIKDSRLKASEMMELHRLYSAKINKALARQKELKATKAKLDRLDGTWAGERNRLDKMKADAGPASKHAKLDRESDTAGDREEKRRYHKEEARRGIKAAR